MSVVARNPYQPGVGTPRPYLADRDEQLGRFRGFLRDFPEKRRNVRLSGLGGVGKTVLLKEYRALASERDWVVIRRDLTTRAYTAPARSPARRPEQSAAGFKRGVFALRR